MVIATEIGFQENLFSRDEFHSTRGEKIFLHVIEGWRKKGGKRRVELLGEHVELVRVREQSASA